MLWFLFTLVVIAVVVYLVVRFALRARAPGVLAAWQRTRPGPVIGVAAAILLVLTLVPASIKVVPVGRALVIFNIMNKQYYVSREGINFILPVINQTAMYDLRRLEYSMSGTKGEGRRRDADDALWAPTSEGLQVGLDVTCWYRLDPKLVFEIHRSIGPDFEERVIRPQVRSIVRMVVSGYGVMDVYSAKREAIQREINDRVRRALEKDGFILDGVVLRNVQFTPEFAAAVEQKQVAQQDAERMKYINEKEQLEADRKAIEATGKARAIEIVSAKLRANPQYIKYLYVDKLAENVKVIVSDQATIMDLKGLIEK